MLPLLADNGMFWGVVLIWSSCCDWCARDCVEPYLVCSDASIILSPALPLHCGLWWRSSDNARKSMQPLSKVFRMPIKSWWRPITNQCLGQNVGIFRRKLWVASDECLTNSQIKLIERTPNKEPQFSSDTCRSSLEEDSHHKPALTHFKIHCLRKVTTCQAPRNTSRWARLPCLLG